MMQSHVSRHVVTTLLISILHILRCLPIVVSHNISYAHHINKRLVSCITSEDCDEFRDCDHHICRNPCHNINCEHIRPGTRCRVELHRPVCKLRSELDDPDQWFLETDCTSHDDCTFEQWCFEDKCREACPSVDCSTWNDDGYCGVEHHLPVCKFKTERFDEEQIIILEKEQRAIGDTCRTTHECAFNLACKSGFCFRACDEIVCYSEDPRNPPYPKLKANVPEDKPSNDRYKCVNQYHVVKCIPNESYTNRVACMKSEDCDEFHECDHDICRNPCHNINCALIRPETRCRVELHRPVCKLRSELDDPDQWFLETDCTSHDDCTFEQWCYDSKCREACANVDCSTWNDDGYCDVEHHLPVCKFKTAGFDEEQIMQLEKEQRVIGDTCTTTHECAFNLACKSGFCFRACDEIVCYSEDSRNLPYPILKAKVPEDDPSNNRYKCVNEYHVIKCIPLVPDTNYHIFDSQKSKTNTVCDSNDGCGEKQICVNRKCTDSCKWVDCQSWSFDGYCDVMDHYGFCRFKTFGVPENEIEALKHQRKRGSRCINSFQCEHQLACISKRCTDPCDLLWCIAGSSHAPVRLVQKRLFSMEWGYDENLKCLSEHHTVRCLLG